MKNETEELLSVKELAFELKRSNDYVYQMRASGFEMIANRATLSQALAWLKSTNFKTKPKQKKGK